MRNNVGKGEVPLPKREKACENEKWLGEKGK